MAEQKIAFILEGPEANGNHLELSVFAEKVGQFLDTLKSRVKDSDKRVTFHVVKLSHSSPATIVCETRFSDTRRLVDNATFSHINKIFDSVQKCEGRGLSDDSLSALEKLAKLSPDKVARAEIRTIGGVREEPAIYKLDDRFNEKLRRVRSDERTVINTIDGKLEQINIHNGANTFKIYASLPAVFSVRCKFPQDLLGKVQNSLGKFVSVSGECWYRPEAPFPYKIDVREMSVLPPSERLPSLEDLYGVAPEATGDKTTEEFVKESRNAWNKGPQ